jgi:hypothetical protein
MTSNLVGSEPTACEPSETGSESTQLKTTPGPTEPKAARLLAHSLTRNRRAA